MRSLFWLLLGSLPLLAQQLTMPEAFSPEQRKLFLKLASSVSAPCCNNGIPVAYHESGMAIYIQEIIRDAITAGKTESAIMDELKSLEIGEREMRVIFTVPENDGLGWATWASPAVVILLGFLGVLYVFKRRQGVRRVLSDDDLMQQYREAILAKANSLKTMDPS